MNSPIRDILRAYAAFASNRVGVDQNKLNRRLEAAWAELKVLESRPGKAGRPEQVRATGSGSARPGEVADSVADDSRESSATAGE